MFTHIKTSAKNKEIVSQLTSKLQLGSENIIARIALAYSLSKDEKLSLNDIKDSGGKEYSAVVLFGSNKDYYIAIIALHYGIQITDSKISKYIKLHIDKGLEIINKDLNESNGISELNFLINSIEKGINNI